MPISKKTNDKAKIIERGSNVRQGVTSQEDLKSATSLNPPTLEEIEKVEKQGIAAASVVAHPARMVMFHRDLNSIEEVRAALGKIGKELVKTAQHVEGTLFSQVVGLVADYLDLKANANAPGVWTSAKESGVKFDDVKKFLRESIAYTRADQLGKDNHNFVGRWQTIDNIIKLAVQAAYLVQAGWCSHLNNPPVPGEPMRIAWVSKATHLEIDKPELIPGGVEKIAYRAVTAVYANMRPKTYSPQQKRWMDTSDKSRSRVGASEIRAQYAAMSSNTVLDEGGMLPKKQPEPEPLAARLKVAIDELDTNERLNLFDAVAMCLEDADTLRSFLAQGEPAAQRLKNFWASVHHVFDDNGNVRPLGDLELTVGTKTA